MLVMGMLLMLANMSIEPIITIYVGQLVEAVARDNRLRPRHVGGGARQHPVGVAARPDSPTASGTGPFWSERWRPPRCC